VNGDLDPTFIITHKIPLTDAQERCLKVVLEP
jgi:hypothetical protein